MKLQRRNSFLARNASNALTIAAAMVVFSPFAMADDLDFSTMVASVGSAAIIAVFMSMGVVKLGPNFAKWAINKVAGFFGR